MKHLAQLNHLKSASLFRIESLELALNEMKLRQNREQERSKMELAEIESRVMNSVKTAAEMDSLVFQCENRLVLRNTQEARKIINDLV